MLLDQDFELKISDFVVAKLLQRDQTDPNMSKVVGPEAMLLQNGPPTFP
jgi:hypothetical protein